MTCFECGKEIESYPCACGYQLKAMKEVKKPHLWIIQHCTRSGCTTAIRSYNGLPESELVCKWCRAKEEQGCAFAVYPTHVPHGPTAP